MAEVVLLALALPWAFLAWQLRPRRGSGWRRLWTEVGCLALVEAAGIFAARPYLTICQVGGGDSYHYALQLADGATQARQGVFPLLVGQSAYAFNGNIHTLGTAPYYVHLGVLLDLLTGRRLPFTALENLTLVLSLLGGGLAAYYAARRLAAGALGAALLAALYVTSPAVLAPPLHYDLLATLLTVPWQPLFWLGLVLSLQRLEDTEGLVWSGLALGMLWYVHPPTAAWLTPALAVAQGLRLALVGRAPGNLARPLLAGALLLALIAYEFDSVRRLGGAYAPTRGLPMAAVIAENVRSAWPGAFVRPMAWATTPYADLQLGYPLWIVLLAASAALVRRRGLPGLFLPAAAAVFILLLLPVPGLNLWLWRLAPARLLDATNAWPMQRFYPMLAALALAAGALALARVRRPRWVVPLLGVFLAWNLSEAAQVQRRAPEETADAATTAKMLLPRNVSLTRSSYLLFGAYPPYFSHGHTDPEFELRLLGPRLEPLADNTQGIARPAAASVAPIAVSPHGEFTTDGVHDYLLAFDLPAGVPGALTVHSNSVDLSYFLPESGGPRAFGSGPQSSRLLPIRTAGQPIESVGITTSVPGVTVRPLPFSSGQLVLHLDSLVPLVARVDARQAGFLETPRVYLPGYRAAVNGRPQPIVRSPAGLVAVPLAPGTNRVVLDYPGPPELKGLYFLSLAAAGVWLAAAATVLLRGDPRTAPLDRAAIRRFGVLRRAAGPA